MVPEPRLKRHYRSKDELRRLLIDEGIGLLVDDGIRGGENITLSRVAARLAARGDDPVTKGSVFGKDRLWANQRDYQLEVQNAFAAGIGEFGLTAGDTYGAAARVIEAADLTTVQGRADAVRELCRVGGRASFEGLLSSRIWRIWLAIWATAMTTDDEKSVGEAIRAGEMNSIRIVIETLYAPFADAVGLRIKDEFGPDGLLMFALCAAALTDGLAIRVRYSAISLSGIDRTVGGSTEQWHLYALGFEALVKQFFEPVAPG